MLSKPKYEMQLTLLIALHQKYTSVAQVFGQSPFPIDP